MNIRALSLIKNMNEQKINAEKIKKIVQSLIEKIDNTAKISVSGAKNGVVEININSDDAETMIGAGGETLRAIRHLARVMARKTFGEPVFIEVDINGYLEKKKNYLRQLAVSSADEAALENKEISLPPMNSYERRIVHMALADRRDVFTESRGCDSDRRVVINPAH